MRRHPVVERLWDEVETTLQALGFELVQMTFGGPPGSADLTVYVDHAGGVTVDDCAEVSQQLSVLLDGLDRVPGSYNLVVSSPGLDRPLGREQDFATYAGQEVLLRYEAASGKSRRMRGTLLGIEGNAVCLQTAGGRQCIPLVQVSGANLVYQWEPPSPA